MVEFGEQLRRAREAKGMTQQSLAEQLYVTRQSVSRWECGDRYPDLLTTQKISQILDVSLDDLLSGKEMTKVVERNPVIENKVANNIMIALYAFVVLAYLATAITVAIRLFVSVPIQGPIQFNDIEIQILAIQAIGTITSIAVFIYGLVNAVMSTLSPKRMGAVLVAYFATLCIADISRIVFLNSGLVLWSTVITSILPGVIGAVVSYLFFIRSQNRKIWVLLIAMVSVWGIFSAAGSLYMSVITAKKYYDMDLQLYLAENLSVNSLLSIAIDVLILYQTYTLYKKRVVASEIEQASASEVQG